MSLQIAIIDCTAPPTALVAAASGQTQFEWGENVCGYKIYPCHRAQLDILSAKTKFVVGFAGSGGGKTCLIGLWLLKQIQRKPKGRFLVVSPTVPTFESSELKRHIIQTFEDTAFEGEWLNAKKTYCLPTGGEIVVKTCGDGGDFAKLTGGQYHAAVADECYLLSAEVWEEIRRRVSNHNGPILAVTTPTGNNWIYEVKQRFEKGDKDYYIRHWSKLANPTVSTVDVDRERLLMSAARFQRMIQGEFAAMEGLIYDVFADVGPLYPVINDDPLKGLPSPIVRVFGGNDWGYKPDPASMLVIAECEDGIMYVVDEVYGTEITPDKLADKARALIDKWSLRANSRYANLGASFGCFWTDVSRPEETAMFRKASVPIRNKRVTDVLTGIAITDQWFRAGRLKIFANCKNLIRELKGYRWDKNRKGETKDMPLGKDDHSCFIAGTLITTDKGVIPIELIRVGVKVLTRKGYRRVIDAAMTCGAAATMTLRLSNGKSLTATANHPIFVNDKGFTPLDAVRHGDSFITEEHSWNSLFTMGGDIGGIPTRNNEATKYITNVLLPTETPNIFIGGYGRTRTAPYPLSIISTIETGIQATTTYPILNSCKGADIYPYIVQPMNNAQGLGGISLLPWRRLRNGMAPKQGGHGIGNTGAIVGRAANQLRSVAKYAATNLRRWIEKPKRAFVVTDAKRLLGGVAGRITKAAFALYAVSTFNVADSNHPKVVGVNAGRLIANKKRQAVYNLTVDGEHEYFANGILVSNCDALRYAISSHKYGATATPVDPYLESEIEETNKAIRLGVLTADPEERRIMAETLVLEQSQRRLYELAYGTQDDDDPHGVWE